MLSLHRRAPKRARISRYLAPAAQRAVVFRLLAPRLPWVACLAGALPALAAPPLDPIVITGAREPVALSDALQDVTLIDRATIEAHAGASIESLLAEQPGVQVATSGGMGSVSSVFVRGANSDSTLLLIDGMRYGSASTGTPIFYNLPLDQIDHIEIVRGPMSSVYGGDAAGGVIQVFTRRGQAGGDASASATLGSERYGAADVGVRGASGALDYALQSGVQRSNGYPYTNPHAYFGIYNPNPDHFEQTSASANLGYAFAPGWSLRVQGLDARGTVQFADGVDPTQPQRTARSLLGSTSGGVTVQGQAAPGWTTSLRLMASRDDYNTDIAVSAYDLGRFTTAQRLASWQNDVATPLGTVLLAAEQLHQSVSSTTTTYATDARTINGLQLGLNGRAGANTWQMNARSDTNAQFGRRTTGALAYGRDLAPAWRVGVSLGTSFVMPSFNDLYYPGYSNPALQPQRGRSKEINLRWRGESAQLRLALFDSRYQDLIALDANYLPVNIGQSRIRGASAQATGRVGALTLGAVLDTMDPRDLTDATQLAHRARNSATLTADWQPAAALTLGASLRAAGARFDDTANLQSLGGYGQVGLHGHWQCNPLWRLSLRLDNATDHGYEPAYGYNAPPRQVFLTLRYGAR